MLSDFDAYITQDKNWSLIKLHGSVNWYHPTTEPFAPETPPPALEWDNDRYECVAPNASLEYVRGVHQGGHTDRYPALALPEGPDDRLVLPPKHRAFLERGLNIGTQQIDVLVIGYSGLDKQVLALLASARSQVRRLTVVSRDGNEARQVYDRFLEAGVKPVWDNVIDGDFGSWADEGGLDRLVDEYGGPYE